MNRGAGGNAQVQITLRGAFEGGWPVEVKDYEHCRIRQAVTNGG